MNRAPREIVDAIGVGIELPVPWQVHSNEQRRGVPVLILVPEDEMDRQPGDFSRAVDVQRFPATPSSTLESRAREQIARFIGGSASPTIEPTTVSGCEAVVFEWTDGVHDLATWIIAAPRHWWVELTALALLKPKRARLDLSARTIGESIVGGMIIKEWPEPTAAPHPG